MNEALEQKINKIIDSRDDTPIIFKVILKKELAIDAQEEILDLAYIRREHSDNGRKSGEFAKSVLLITTNYGLMVVEEGMNDTHLEYGGYRIRHMMYSKIKSLDFNSCLLIGQLRAVTGSPSEPDLMVEFNTSKYYQEIATIVDIIRGKMVELERRAYIR
jgi:hypothetical protein